MAADYGAFVAECERHEADLASGAEGDEAGAYQAVPEQLRQLRQQGRCIAVAGLSKTYRTAKGPVHAVQDLSLTFFEGQITALLGSNGAGKSTTISSIAGLIPFEAGGAFVGGRSCRTDLSAVRGDLGICPQGNVLFPNLTVAEHLRLFAGLKGLARGAATEEAVASMIAEVGLAPKRNTVSRALSGGMKRKLQLGMALIGGNKFIICDEPTSGLDPAARTFVQATLARHREGRTIVLSTHYMDEADLLGDRVAIMAKGRLMCAGTSLFLKKRYGVGYQLTLVSAKEDASAAHDAVAKIVQQRVPEATVASSVGAELIMELPLSSSAKFADMLEDIDQRSAALHVTDVGISVTTLENVFLKVAQGHSKKDLMVQGGAKRTPSRLGSAGAGTGSGATDPHKVAAMAHSDLALAPAAAAQPSVGGMPEPQQSEGLTLGAGELKPSTARHMRALVNKRWLYAKRDKGAWCCQLLLPIAFLVLGFVAMKASVRATVLPYWFGPATDGWNAAPRQNPVPFNLGEGGSVSNATTEAAMAGFVLPRVQLAQNLSVGPTGPYCRTFTSFNASVRPLYRLAPGLPIAQLLAPGANLCTNASAYPIAAAAMSDALAASRGELQASRYGAALFNVLPAVGNSRGNSSGSYAADYSAVYNFTGVHSLPLMVNRINNALLASLGLGNVTVSASNYVLPRTLAEQQVSAGFTAFSAALALGIAFSFVPASMAVFIVREKEERSLEQQLINGVSLVAYWGSSYVWDFIVLMVPTVLAWILIFAFQLTAFTANIGAVIIIFLLFALAVIPFTYCITFAFQQYRYSQFFMITINLIGGLVLLVTAFVMFLLENTFKVNNVLINFYRLIPTFAFAHGVLQVANLPIVSLVLNSAVRGGNPSRPVQYTVWSWDVAGGDIVFLAAEAVVYLALLVLLQRRFPGGLCACSPRPRGCCAGGAAKASAVELAKESSLLPAAGAGAGAGEDPEEVFRSQKEDGDVLAERERVQRAAAAGGKRDVEARGDGEDDVLVLNGARKVYPAIGPKAKPKVAVQDVTLGVHRGECFGLLGVNGAGKSTTMALIAGSTPPTAGSVRVLGYDVDRDRALAQQSLGYCPQVDPLFDLLTGREHLALYAAIKGVAPARLPALVERALEELSLTPFADKPAGGYSGGNKRKLSLGIAIVGDPAVLLCDEVSAGVDPQARRFIWDVLLKLSKSSSVVLTTHSMEECEALCSRLGIMVDGRMRCLGSAQRLKTLYGQGFQLEATLKIAAEQQVDALVDALGLKDKPLVAGEAEVKAALAAAGDEAFFDACFTPSGSACLLHQQLTVGSGTAAPRAVADWLFSERAFRAMDAFVTGHFAGAVLLDRQGLRVRYALPKQKTMMLHDMFRAIEAKGELFESYALSQATLENVFQRFADTQSQDIN